LIRSSSATISTRSPPAQAVTFECWTSTAALAPDTKRIRIGQLVTCNGYRHPALLAKMASTVDTLSHGRLNFGIGAGWYEHECRAYGYDFPDGPTRLCQLRDAVQLILRMWSDDEAVYEGTYHQVRGAINQPKGVQKPHVPIRIKRREGWSPVAASQSIERPPAKPTRAIDWRAFAAL
jgi:alkanesulfonate monooxygenase SsuD/methylene tetrahydromethanopterin reductase-like flavin-dependent oxidoreductase (luciferase family)